MVMTLAPTIAAAATPSDAILGPLRKKDGRSYASRWPATGRFGGLAASEIESGGTN
jgi:hypothetical protein